MISAGYSGLHPDHFVEVEARVEGTGGTVHGGVHQTFVENKLINEAIRRHHLRRAYVEQVVQSSRHAR